MRTSNGRLAAMVVLLALVVAGLFVLVSGVREESTAAQAEVEEAVAVETRGVDAIPSEAGAANERVELAPTFVSRLKSSDVWELAVRAEQETGEALAVEEGSLTFSLVEHSGATKRVTGKIRAGRWSATMPCDGVALASLELWAARIGERRFVEAERLEKLDPHFDGTDVLFLRPAPATVVRVIDPRTTGLASAAELVVSTVDDAELGYRFSFSLPFEGQPLRFDTLSVRELEEVREVEVRAVLAGVGEARARVRLGFGMEYELRPSRMATGRVVWHRPAGFWPSKPTLTVRPVESPAAQDLGSGSGTRVIRLGPSYFEGRDVRGAFAPDDGPWIENVEHLPDGEYVAEVTAEPRVATVRVTLASERFSVVAGEFADVELHTEPGESDPWRLLAVELELPPGVEDRRLQAGLLPLDRSQGAYFNFMPVTEDTTRFGTVLVLRGEHELSLAQPLLFTTRFAVTRVPEHVERVVVPAPLEYHIRFRDALSGGEVELGAGQVSWRTRTGTSLDANEWPATRDAQSEGEPLRIRAPGDIELRLGPFGPHVLADGEWVTLRGGGDQLVRLRSKPSVVVRVSTRDDLHNLSALVHPWVRQSEQGSWMELPGYWLSWDTEPLQEFEGWLPFEGEFELDLRGDEAVLPLQRRRGTLQLDQHASFEFELVRAK